MNSKFRFGAALLAAIAVCVSFAVAPAATAAALPGLFSPESQLAGGVALIALGGMLDVFNTDAFQMRALTDAINKIPFVPGRLGSLGFFRESGTNSTKIAVEQRDGILSLLSPTPRGGPGETSGKVKAELIPLIVPHFQKDDAVYADEVQGVREFGSEDQLKTVQGVINERMAEHTTFFDATLEYQRIGAWKGLITYADNSTLDLFSTFGVSQESEIDFDLDNASPVSGALISKINAMTRLIAKNLGGIPYTGVYALVGDTFWDNLIAHAEVRDTFKYQEGSQLRTAMGPFRTLDYGGVTWENYRGGVGATDFVHTDKAHFAPTGVPGLFRTVFAPADYMETVNTLGIPRYAKAIPMDNDKGVRLEMQSNPLSYCTRPKVLIKGKRT